MRVDVLHHLIHYVHSKLLQIVPNSLYVWYTIKFDRYHCFINFTNLANIGCTMADSLINYCFINLVYFFLIMYSDYIMLVMVIINLTYSLFVYFYPEKRSKKHHQIRIILFLILFIYWIYIVFLKT